MKTVVRRPKPARKVEKKEIEDQAKSQPTHWNSSERPGGLKGWNGFRLVPVTSKAFRRLLKKIGSNERRQALRQMRREAAEESKIQHERTKPVAVDTSLYSSHDFPYWRFTNVDALYGRVVAGV